MKVQKRIVAIVAAGVMGVGALALATPAVADVVAHPLSWITADAPGTGPGDGTGRGAGDGTGPGRGAGNGAGNGGWDGAAVPIPAEQGTLTDAQRSTLAAMAQEEKLAHDLYIAFDDRYDLRVFERISGSEQQHQTALRTLMERYGVTDPTAGLANGVFSDPAVQATYDKLLAQGSKDADAAYGVGKTVELLDIDDLQRALDGLTTAPDVQQVYTNLLAGSRQHLSTFDSWLSR